MSVTVDQKRLEPASIPWERPLFTVMHWDWDRLLLVGLLLISIVTRFWDLGVRSYNHDESIHTHYSFDLYQGRGYVHNPIYHGPFLYHLTALTFFLLGDTDVTGRVPNVVLGLIILSLPFFFRKWLGRRGWFITSLLLLISPSVTYYSRFNRHDVYVEVFVLLMLLCVCKYLDERRNLWLYGAAASLAFSFTAMETTFIFLGLFFYCLCTIFTARWLQSNQSLGLGSLARSLIAALFGVPFFAVYILYFILRSLFFPNASPAVGELDPRAEPAFDLAVLFGTLSLPFIITPIALQLFHFDPAGVPTSLQQTTPYLVALISVLLLASGVGLVWDARRWAVSALLFFPIVLFFFTTVFTNFAGVGTGFIGSLGYWLSQQGVARGGQPWYYYIGVTLPLYEYLPYLFGLLAALWLIARKSSLNLLLPIAWLLFAFGFYLFAAPLLPQEGLLKNAAALLAAVTLPLAAMGLYDPEEPECYFPLFMVIWAVGNLIIFSWAGEKMPWLTMHLAIPLSFLTGYLMERVLRADWLALYHRGAALFALFLLLAFAIIVMQLFFGPAALQGLSLEQLNQTMTVLFAVIVLAALGVGLVRIGLRLGLDNALRVTVATVFLILAAFTVHTMMLAAYINSDVAVETIIYAQGTPDDPIAMHEIDDLSRRLCAQTPLEGKKTINCDNNTIKVAYDDESSWPFVWYLRNYRNQQYFGKSPGAPFDAEVVIVGPTNEAGVKPFLGSRYVRRQMRLIWWPLEGYKDLSWSRISEYLKPVSLVTFVRDIWFFHKYSESLSTWPLVHTFAFYVRKDIATSLWDYSGVVNPVASNPAEDEYSKRFLPDVRAQAVVGVPGKAPGQLTGPRAITFDTQGNLYVSDSGSFRVEKFDPAGKFVAQFGSGPGNGPGQFADGPGGNPWGLAVDATGNLFVADTWNHRIVKFDPGGRVLTQWGIFGQANSAGEKLELLYGPRAIAIDKSGNLWVTDTGNKRVVKFDPNGRPLAGFGGSGADPGQFLEPVGIASDAQGNLYVADTWNQRIQKFDPNFVPLAQWPLQVWDSQSVLNKPFLAVDREGSLYATDPDNFRVIKLSADGKLAGVFGGRGSDLGNFEVPTGIGISPEGLLYVVDSGNSRVLVFQPLK